MGYCAQHSSVRDVQERGMYALLDGEAVMGFVAYLLRERAVALGTAVQSMYALTKGISFAISHLAGDEVKTTGFEKRVETLTSQLQTWASKTPTCKPTFKEMVLSGKFIDLRTVLEKTLPFIKGVVEAFDGSVAKALAVRDAAVLSCVAGDGAPNTRVGELVRA